MEFTQEQKLLQQVVSKAWEDAEFKNALVADPVATIEKFTGTKLNLPEGKKIVVRDQTSDATLYINIPVNNGADNSTDDVELNEEQLEAVAGGQGLPTSITGCWDPNPGNGGTIPWDIFTNSTVGK